MAKKNTAEPTQNTTIEEPIEGEEVEIDQSQVKDLFFRPPTTIGVTRQLRMKRTLTRPLVSMARRKTLAVECTSDIYTMALPLTGRGGGMGETRVFEAKELIPTGAGFVDGDECLVLVHEIMSSSLHNAGYRTLERNPDEKAEQEYLQKDGKSLVGALLGFMSGDIVDGKRYRQISVAELEA